MSMAITFENYFDMQTLYEYLNSNLNSNEKYYGIVIQHSNIAMAFTYFHARNKLHTNICV